MSDTQGKPKQPPLPPMIEYQIGELRQEIEKLYARMGESDDTCNARLHALTALRKAGLRVLDARREANGNPGQFWANMAPVLNELEGLLAGWEQLREHEPAGGGRCVIGKQRVRVLYRNHRGEERERIIVPLGVWFGTTEWHEGEQWFLECLDVEKPGAKTRSFAMAHIQRWVPFPEETPEGAP